MFTLIVSIMPLLGCCLIGNKQGDAAKNVDMSWTRSINTQCIPDHKEFPFYSKWNWITTEGDTGEVTQHVLLSVK